MLRRGCRRNDSERICFPCLHDLVEFQQVHVVIPVLVNKGRLASMGLAEDNTVAGSQQVFTGRAFTYRSHERYFHVRPVDLAVCVPYIHQMIGSFDNAHRCDFDIFLRRDLYDRHRRVRKVSQRHHRMTNRQLVADVEGRNKNSPLHVE